MGDHKIKFKAYLKDIDPEAKFSKTIDLTLNIQVNSPSTKAADIGASLLKDAQEPPKFDDTKLDGDTIELEA